MKIFTFIMSVYLLGLSCIPCNDRQEGNTFGEQKISATSPYQHQQPADEACTPFCNCSHCPGSAFYQQLASIKIPKAIFQSEQFYSETSFISTDFHSIWQPPKIA